MTRRLHPSHAAIEPNGRTFADYPEGDDPQWFYDDFKKEPGAFEAGDVVPVKWWPPRASQPALGEMLIVQRLAHYREHSGDWLAKYRARFKRVNGEWSNTWVYIWPGDIERGFQLRKGEA